ncbi:protein OVEREXPRESSOR OF CATIONIC PEROXIDASE 3-like [Triticum dicoccoides]|uniref:protein OVEREXPRESSOR OF CATIONIC PEROXIDASE 3-like n=1 Tax=Triticum dicoccoides TaxID=85692 RepID=UPI0018917EF7|nr:protein OVEREXPRESSOR OF CATIONIC PEROXIDASE 3-like [Triticum dicoccoides]
MAPRAETLSGPRKNTLVQLSLLIINRACLDSDNKPTERVRIRQNIRNELVEMATTVVPLAAAMAAAPRSRLLTAPDPSPFLGIRPLLCRSARSVACALRRPSKYKNKIKDEVVVAEDDIDGGDEDDDDEGGLEALFKQLEEDLKNDDLSVDDDDDEISEEDMARFEQVLAEAMGDTDVADESAVDSAPGSEVVGNDEVADPVEKPELKSWQLRRLARALNIGRRKTSIKNLAGELGLDRGLVIELLRNPPPELLLMSDSLPDEAPSKPETKEIETSPVADEVEVDEIEATETKPQMDLPVHVMSTEWSAQKRLKKAQLETLEKVYLKSKRPTNTMISSIVQVTSLPRKTIIKWFEDRREQDGVPDRRAAYMRSLSETMAS